MDNNEIVNFRLTGQQISKPICKTAQELVSWMGAMQAQDYNMAKWAVGVRLPDTTIRTIEKAIEKGEIIRTHVLRPTWHFVSPVDIYWMLGLTAPRIKSSMNSRDKELGLTKSIYQKSNKLIEKALVSGNHLTREEIVKILEKAKIKTDENRSSHLLMNAELDRLICSGIPKNNKPTYALLSERAPEKKTYTRDEALAVLAQKYFTSHGPATIKDFIWWSGLTVSDARHALEMVKSNFYSVTIDSSVFWFNKSIDLVTEKKVSVHLLPAYDEYLISYKDRNAVLPNQHNRTTISNNGLFRPIILIDGKVAGIWSRTTKKDKVLIEIKLFQTQNKNIQNLIYTAAMAFGEFIEKEVVINFIK